MDHLALQIRNLNKVSIDNADPANACRSQIQQKGRPQTTSPNTKHGGLFQTLLPFNTQLGKHQMTGVAATLFRGQTFKRHRSAPAAPADPPPTTRPASRLRRR